MRLASIHSLDFTVFVIQVIASDVFELIEISGYADQSELYGFYTKHGTVESGRVCAGKANAWLVEYTYLYSNAL